MTTTIFTLFYDGSNWIALIDRHEDGMRFIGKHVFGVEPSNPELVAFLRERDARRTQRELTGVNDALTLFAEFRKAELEKRARGRMQEKCRQRAVERLGKSQKKRQKRRGH